jgi:hypothetical protein
MDKRLTPSLSFRAAHHALLEHLSLACLGSAVPAHSRLSKFLGNHIHTYIQISLSTTPLDRAMSCFIGPRDATRTSTCSSTTLASASRPAPNRTELLECIFRIANLSGSVPGAATRRDPTSDTDTQQEMERYVTLVQCIVFFCFHLCALTFATTFVCASR